MNKQTKALRKLGLGTKVVKGTGGFQSISNEIFKGQPCITGFKQKDKNPMNKRTSRWTGGRKAEKFHEN